MNDGSVSLRHWRWSVLLAEFRAGPKQLADAKLAHCSGAPTLLCEEAIFEPHAWLAREAHIRPPAIRSKRDNIAFFGRIAFHAG